MKNMIKIVILLILSISVLVPLSAEEVKATEPTNTGEIIHGGTIKEYNEVTKQTYTDYELEPVSSMVSVQPMNNNETNEFQSTWVDPTKEENNSGEMYITFSEDKVVEYNTSTVVNESPGATVNLTNANNEYFVVENGVITEASEANFITIGGSDYTSYIYPTLEDIKAGTNGIPLSGDGVDGKYHETINYKGKDYASVTISGYTGYINMSDIQIVPSCIDMATSFYFAKDGVWYYAIAVDPLTSSKYEIWPMDDAPDWAKEGVKYYSSDNENFTTHEYMGPTTYVDYQNQAYFQNLSFRSTTSYSGSQLKSYLTHIGKTNGEYYNATNAFVDKQEYFGVNGLLMFSNANLESAYGTSHYAQECYNFFGRGAYDSNPDNACIQFGFDTPQDAIYAQAIFYNNNYFDQGYSSYYQGTYVGNKSGGLNVYYASDPNWGSKIASGAYECDKYLGGKDNNKYKIIEITAETYLYKESSLTNHVMYQGDYTIYESDIDHNNAGYFGFNQPGAGSPQCVNPAGGPCGYGNPKVVVVDETSNAYKVQLDTPVNAGSSGYETWTKAEKGSYPNYEAVRGGTTNYVHSGYANFANEYETMDDQQFWISKSNTRVVANNPITDTSVSTGCAITTSDKINSNGDRVVTTTSSDNSKICTTTYYGTSSTKKYYSEDRFVNGFQTVYIDKSYYSNGKLKSYTNESFHSDTHEKTYDLSENYYENGQLKDKTEYKYYSDGIMKSKLFEKYTSTGIITYRETKNCRPDGTNETITYEVFNGSNGYRTDYDQYTYNENGKRTKELMYTYHSNGKVKTKDTKYYYDDRTNKDFTYQKYDTNGVRTDYDEYLYYSNGKRSYEAHYTYFTDASVYTKQILNYYDNGQLKDQTNQSYDDNGTRSSYHKYEYQTNGYKIEESHYDYHANGGVKWKEVIEYNSSGLKHYYIKTTYDSSGNLTSTSERYY